jgi:predicted transcriptional regulator
MAELHISDELNAQLERAAGQLGCTKDELAEDAISLRIGEYRADSGTSFTEDEIAKLRRGLDQLNRGETVSGEEIQSMFDAWRAKWKAR